MSGRGVGGSGRPVGSGRVGPGRVGPGAHRMARPRMRRRSRGRLGSLDVSAQSRRCPAIYAAGPEPRPRHGAPVPPPSPNPEGAGVTRLLGGPPASGSAALGEWWRGPRRDPIAVNGEPERLPQTPGSWLWGRAPPPYPGSWSWGQRSPHPSTAPPAGQAVSSANTLGPPLSPKQAPRTAWAPCLLTGTSFPTSGCPVTSGTTLCLKGGKRSQGCWAVGPRSPFPPGAVGPPTSHGHCWLRMGPCQCSPADSRVQGTAALSRIR